MNNSEIILKKIEERLSELEQKVQAQEARMAISDLMGRYVFYYSAGAGERIVDELWTKSEDASLEYGASAQYENLWKIKTFYFKDPVPGKMNTLALSSPILSISNDGMRACGLWTAFGTETDAGDLGGCVPGEFDGRRVLLSSHTDDGKSYRAEVLLQKYDVTFILEDGAWKILRLHVGEFFRCPYDRDWVLYAKERFETDGMWLESLFETSMELPPIAHGENLPSGPSTWHWQYTTEAVLELFPKLLPGDEKKI